MPVSIRKLPNKNKYRVKHGNIVSAKATSKAKAGSQARLLQGVAHGWKPNRKNKK